jgi:hypothetical protein
MTAVMTALRVAGLTLLVALVTTRAFAQTPAQTPLQAPVPTVPPTVPAPPQPPPPPTIPQDPTTLTFNASVDHDASDASGPRVVKYLIEFSPVDSLGKAKTVDLGKPVPENGQIVVPLASLGLAPGRYVAQARVVGPTSSAVSGVVGPFQLGKPKPNKGSAASAKAAAPPAPPKPAAPAGPAPNSAAPTGSGDQPAPGDPKREDTDPKRRGFWQRLYGLIVG